MEWCFEGQKGKNNFFGDLSTWLTTWQLYPGWSHHWKKRWGYYEFWEGNVKFSIIMIMINCFYPSMTLFNLMLLQARSIDPYLVTYMDEYAMLLKVKSDCSMLNKLVHDLLNIDPTRPEVFVALSVLWETKDERGALSYAEKVCYQIRALRFVIFSTFTNIHTAIRAFELMKGI